MSDLVQTFTFQERLGIFFTIEGASLSVFSAAAIIGFAIYKWVRRSIYKWSGEVVVASDASDSSLFLNLMVADLIQGLGNFPNIRWMNDAMITEGTLCTAQAAIKQVGIVGVAMTSLAIALQTFAVLVLRWRPPRHAGKTIIALIWLFVALDIGISNAVHRNDDYYGNTGYWCWIREEFKTEQIVTEYLWLWFAGAMMIVLYGIMFLVMRGVFVIDHGIHWRSNRERVKLDKLFLTEAETAEDQKLKAIANLMLFYPAVYIFAVFPNSLSRWLSFDTSTNVPPGFTLFAASIFSLSGFFNLVLFMLTRPELVKGAPITRPLDHVNAVIPSVKHDHLPSNKHTARYGHLPSRSVQEYSDADYVEPLGHLPTTTHPASVYTDAEPDHSPDSAINNHDIGRLPSINNA